MNPNRDIISVSVQVKEAEALFGVTLAVFRHNATGARLVHPETPRPKALTIAFLTLS